MNTTDSPWCWCRWNISWWYCSRWSFRWICQRWFIFSRWLIVHIATQIRQHFRKSQPPFHIHIHVRIIDNGIDAIWFDDSEQTGHLINARMRRIRYSFKAKQFKWITAELESSGDEAYEHEIVVLILTEMDSRKPLDQSSNRPNKRYWYVCY